MCQMQIADTIDRHGTVFQTVRCILGDFIIRRLAHRPVTAGQMGLTSEDAGYPIVLIEDGALKRENLRAAGVDEAWVTGELARRGCGSVREVYLLLRFGNGSVYFAKKQ